MFDIAPSELLLVGFVALVVIGPKDLPKAMRVVGYWVGKARGVARQFRSGFDSMVREAELEEMEKRWASENERIMREHPQPAADDVPAVGDDGETAPVMVEKPAVTAADPMAPSADPVAKPDTPDPFDMSKHDDQPDENSGVAKS
jgi:sec-independent protein translocase protein TatB